MQIIPPDINLEISLLQRMNQDVATRAIPRAMRRCGSIAYREAVRNAPRSPTQTILNNMRKTKRRRKAGARSTGRVKPGGLERSISLQVNASNAEVFVATNSEAGRYAFRIHEEKGISWHERGPGTITKGAQADAKFIERAVYENQAEFQKIINQEFDRVKIKGN